VLAKEGRDSVLILKQLVDTLPFSFLMKETIQRGLTPERCPVRLSETASSFR